jgi:hypothetical protein
MLAVISGTIILYQGRSALNMEDTNNHDDSVAIFQFNRVINLERRWLIFAVVNRDIICI